MSSLDAKVKSFDALRTRVNQHVLRTNKQIANQIKNTQATIMVSLNELERFGVGEAKGNSATALANAWLLLKQAQAQIDSITPGVITLDVGRVSLDTPPLQSSKKATARIRRGG